jgi:hypothetical protein
MNVLVLSQGIYEGTFYCRWLVPERILTEKYGKDLKITMANDPRQFVFTDYDAVILYRWFHPQFHKFVKGMKAKSPSKPFWIYETDDLLLDIPVYNYAKGMISSRTIAMTMELCDGFIFSTQTLADQCMRRLFEARSKPYTIVENRLDKDIWGEPQFVERNPGDPLRIGYEGTSNRFKIRGMAGKDDFTHLEKVFERHSSKSKDRFQWVFFGGIPHHLENSDIVEYWPWTQYYHDFVDRMKALKFQLGISPLVNNDFNKSKSNIKRLDYYAAGAAGLYSDLPVYRETETPEKLLLKNSEITWQNIIEDVEASEEFRRELWELEHDYFTKNPDKIWLQDSVDERYQCLMNLLGNI